MTVPKQPARKPGDPLARPRDAASLVVYRHNGRDIEVLMGERHRNHRFMPSRFVFPGGRVDRTDSRIRVAAPLRDGVAACLERTSAPARARALAAAAVRETFEETGLVLGAPDPRPDKPVPENWREFFATGMAPDLRDLDYVARALTPPIRPIRFNARFFMIDGERMQGALRSNGELLGLQWVPARDVRCLEVASITARIAELVADRLERHATRAAQPVVFFKTMDGVTHTLIPE